MYLSKILFENNFTSKVAKVTGSNLSYLATHRTISHGCQIVLWDPLNGENVPKINLFRLCEKCMVSFYDNP